MKKDKIVFWVSTGLIFVFEGLLPLLTINSEEARQGIMLLGYPAYFVVMLSIFKGLGGFALILPQVPKRIKEWAYAGFGFDFISAFVSIWVMGGVSIVLGFPIIAMVILVLSYWSYHKINS